jgi:APA family basic amino acid/polyamine antiporter
VLPALAVLACAYLMLNLPVETWLRFAIWMVIGFVVYFLYGRRRSSVGSSG